MFRVYNYTKKNQKHVLSLFSEKEAALWSGQVSVSSYVYTFCGYIYYKRRQLQLAPALTNSQPQTSNEARNLRELYNLFSLPHIMIIKTRRMGWAVHVTPVGQIRNAYKILSENRKTKHHLGPRHRQNNDTKKDIRELGQEGVG